MTQACTGSNGHQQITLTIICVHLMVDAELHAMGDRL